MAFDNTVHIFTLNCLTAFIMSRSLHYSITVSVCEFIWPFFLLPSIFLPLTSPLNIPNLLPNKNPSKTYQIKIVICCFQKIWWYCRKGTWVWNCDWIVGEYLMLHVDEFLNWAQDGPHCHLCSNRILCHFSSWNKTTTVPFLLYYIYNWVLFHFVTHILNKSTSHYFMNLTTYICSLNSIIK